MRFTKRPTPAQVRQGLALFAMAADYAREAKKARQAHAIEEGATKEDRGTGRWREEINAVSRESDRAGKVGMVPKGRSAHGDKEPRRSGDFLGSISTTGEQRHG